RAVSRGRARARQSRGPPGPEVAARQPAPAAGAGKQGRQAQEKPASARAGGHREGPRPARTAAALQFAVENRHGRLVGADLAARPGLKRRLVRAFAIFDFMASNGGRMIRSALLLLGFAGAAFAV